jgi:serine/threonine protein kinase
MNEETLFHRALAEPPAARAAFLDRACGDAELRRRVEVLLIAHDNPGSFLNNPAAGAAVTTDSRPGDTPTDRPPPSLPGDYEILRELGRGGMGVVYLANQKSLGRAVAVKVLRPGEATFGPLVKRFLEEARHLARLRHPNIVSIHEIGRADQEPYFTMDYVEGQPLSAILAGGRPGTPPGPASPPGPAAETRTFTDAESGRDAGAASSSQPRKRLSPTQALAILKQAAAGVQHAHEHGIIHRDLKPGNVLVDASGHAYVTDFGLARDMAHSSELTRSGEVMGTPAYMAPEQARGQKDLIGEATDVHALGVILYEMLTGRLPYGNDAPANVIVRLLTDEPTPPRRIDRRIPRDLETICLKAMAKAPERRYASVKALLEDIRRFEAGEPVLARRPGLLSRAVRVVRRHWKPVAAAAVTAVVVLALAPRLFDKSAEELLKWADEEQFRGEYASAARIYARAYCKSPEEKRRGILESLLRCGRQANDPKAVAAAVQSIVDVDPDVSFQEFDWAVGEAWGARQNMRELGRLNLDEKRRLLEIGEKRILLVVSGTHCSEAERQEAEKHLARCRTALAALQTMPDLVFELPTGDADELLRQAADPKGFEWSRGTASFAAGAELERTGDLPAALKAYRQAYDLMRVAFPTYAGRTSNIQQGREVGRDREMKECRMLREVQQSIRRLDPAAPDTLRGGLRFRIVGVDVPSGFVQYLQVALHDAKLKNPQLWPTPGGGAPSQLDQTVWVGVADGKYTLSVTRGGFWGGPSARGDTRKLPPAGFELDFDGLPTEVEIAGETKEFTIRARPLEVITLLQPAADAGVDLRTGAFHWAELPGAKYYTLGLAHEEPIPGGVRVNPLLDVRTESTSVSLESLPGADVKKLAPLTAGRTGKWSVHAYDAKDRHLGASAEDRRFTVTQRLAEK